MIFLVNDRKIKPKIIQCANSMNIFKVCVQIVDDTLSASTCQGMDEFNNQFSCVKNCFEHSNQQK